MTGTRLEVFFARQAAAEQYKRRLDLQIQFWMRDVREWEMVQENGDGTAALAKGWPLVFLAAVCARCKGRKETAKFIGLPRFSSTQRCAV